MTPPKKQFLVSGGVFVGTLRHLGKDEHDQLTIEAMSAEAVTTSEIEGEILDRASVQSSLRRQLGLATNERRVRPAERGIAEMMVDLYRSFAEPLSKEMLFRWHRMVMSGSRNLRDVGRYRTNQLGQYGGVFEQRDDLREGTIERWFRRPFPAI